ncbi:PQQ-dependent sugar dehydrogenase [Mesobacillus harenae]|uniref:PQQ-dependent sugar dehydrogenase n=1 Tax=Mesobacillus harenae TaxID=2213203 RepID=UPI001580FF2C|nr:PQQ-dependent sugar dehydrogenase [Mesobacillus harenae]
MGKILIPVWLMLLSLVAACSNDNSESSQSPGGSDEETFVQTEAAEVLAEQLNVPWSIAKNGETFFLSERPGAIVKVETGQMTRQDVRLNKPLSNAPEAGLLGFVLSPDFNETSRAYAYYTYQDATGQFNRIVELLAEGEGWTEAKVLLDKLPSGQVHHGGRLKIGPDNKLYATTGDASSEPEIAQNVESLGGKILRLNFDGTVPEDNPFKDSFVYSYGHRNPQGLGWKEGGTMYASEHGPSAQDEINQIQAGKNYGWPFIKGDEEREGMETPIFNSGDSTWAPSGIAISNDKLYAASLRGQAIRVFNLKENETNEVVSGLGRIRDVMIDGDYMYFISNNTDGRGTPDETDDKLYRIPLSAINGK